LTKVRPESCPARSTSGEPGRAADCQAFASLSYLTDRQVLRNPHVGRPGFLVSMSIHPRTAVRPGRHACLLLIPNCQSWSARSRHNIVYDTVTQCFGEPLAGAMRFSQEPNNWLHSLHCRLFHGFEAAVNPLERRVSSTIDACEQRQHAQARQQRRGRPL